MKNFYSSLAKFGGRVTGVECLPHVRVALGVGGGGVFVWGVATTLVASNRGEGELFGLG